MAHGRCTHGLSAGQTFAPSGQPGEGLQKQWWVAAALGIITVPEVPFLWILAGKVTSGTLPRDDMTVDIPEHYG